MKRFKPAPRKIEYDEIAKMILDSKEDVIEIEVEDGNKARILIFALKHRLLIEEEQRLYSFRTYKDYAIVTIAKEHPRNPYEISEWTIRNLNDFGNSVVSNFELKRIGGIERAERYLSDRLQVKVMIYRADSCEWETPLYIAKIVKEEE